MYVLRNCHLIPELTEGTSLTEADLLIDGAYIKEIAPCGTAFESLEKEIDMEHMTVMPGLIDAHVHLRMMGGGMQASQDDIPAVTLDELRFAQWLLDNGYTTVRDVGDNKACPSIALRDYIDAGKIQGPRLFCSGPTLTPSDRGMQKPYSSGHHYKVDSPMEMRHYARHNLMMGADFIKLYGTSSAIARRGGTPGSQIMAVDEMEAAVEVATRKNTYCAIHCHGGEACENAARVGVRTIEHATFIEPETLKYLETRKAEGHGIVITISVVKDNSWGTIPGSVYQGAVRHLTGADQYDILIGWGTDTSWDFYQKHPYREFEMRKNDLGFSNINILKQATINTAVLINQGEKIGSVRAGKYADLIAVNGDPAADITAMYHKPVHVIKEGQLIR